MHTFHVKHLLVAALLSATLLPASAQKIYRCPGAGGSTTFSDTPCASGQGAEVVVKPSSGAAPAAQPKPDPQTRGAMDKRNAEYNAQLSPECRRAREAFQAKAQQKGGMDELMKEGNPISKAWEACEFEAKEAIGKLHTKDRDKAEADERKRREQEASADKQRSCTAQRKVLDERRPRLAQLSEQDRKAFATLEQEVTQNCR